MTTDVKVTDEKLLDKINTEAEKISALSSGKFDEYQFLTSEKVLPSDQIWIFVQTKFKYSSIRISLKKQVKTIKELGER